MYKSILNLIGGSAVVQFLQFFLFPIVAGLFGPETIGTYGYLLSIAAISASIVNLRIENIVMLIDRRRVNHIAYALCLITPFMSLVAALGAGFFQLWGGRGKEISFVFLYFLIFSVNASQSLSLCMIKINNLKNFHLHNLVRVILAFLFPIILVPYFDDGLYLLILFNVFSGVYLGCASLVSLPRKEIKLNIWKLRNFIIWMFFCYKKNFTIGVPQGFLNAVSHNIPNIMFVLLFDPLSCAAFIVLDKMFRAPIGLVNNGVRNVVMSINLVGINEIKKVQLILVGIGIGGAFISFPLTRYVGPYFGPNWVLAAEYFPWISIWGAGYMANSIGSAFIAKYLDYGNLFLVQSIDTVLRVFVIYFSYKFDYGFLTALISYVLISLMFNGYVCVRGWCLYVKNR